MTWRPYTDDVATLLDRHALVDDTVSRYPIPSSRRNRYEELERFPDGLLVTGDAIASFNPIYAQGMSVAAFEALCLHHCLADGDDDLAKRFFARAADVVDTAWTMSTGPDFAFPQTEGPKPSGGRLIRHYMARLTSRAKDDPVVSAALAAVIRLEQPPTRLFLPRVVWRVLWPRLGSSSGRRSVARTRQQS